MLNAARALPAGPGGQDAEVFPLRERFRFRDNFGQALQDLRRYNAAFAALAKGPWALFIGISVHWQSSAEAWPSQQTLARFSGCSTRAVRGYAVTLERGGFVRLRRERQANGSERIYYAPGPVLLAALATFIEKYPRERPTKALRRQPAEALSDGLAETIAGAPAEAASMEPKDQIRTSSSCEDADVTALEPAAPVLALPLPEPPLDLPLEEQEVVVTRADREIARITLAARMKRKYPKRPPPRWYDRADVEMVAKCTAAIEGDRETKLQTNRDAIDGAFCASKEGPPTSRFIWARLEHFLEHVERGRRKASTEERVARSRAQDHERVHPSPPLRTGPITPDEVAAFRAEIEEIKATVPRAFREHLDAILESVDRETSANHVDALTREQVEADMKRIFGPRIGPDRGSDGDGFESPGTQ